MNYSTAHIHGKPWAITPSYYRSIADAFATYGVDFEYETEVDNAGPRIENGIAYICVSGVMMKELSPITALFGGVSTDALKEQIGQALSNAEIKGIVLMLNTPGGTVDGSFSLAEYVYGARNSKPIIAYVDGSALSAGYLLASACTAIVCEESSDLGSIGVTLTRPDYTQANAEAGVKNTVFIAGKYKSAYNPDTALTDEMTASIQATVDTYYRLFVAKVALYRGFDPDFVLAEQADARILVGADAIEKKLADHKGNLETAIELIIKKGETIMPDQNETQTPAEATAEAQMEAVAVVEVNNSESVTQAIEEALALNAVAVKAERERASRITTACAKLGLKAEFTTNLIESDANVEQALAKAIDEASKSARPVQACTDHQDRPVAGDDPYGKARLEKARAYQRDHKCSLAQAIQAVTK